MKITNKIYSRAMMTMDAFNGCRDCEAIGLVSENGTSDHWLRKLNDLITIMKEMEVEVTLNVICTECGMKEETVGIDALGCCNEKSTRALSMSIDGKVIPSRKANLYIK